MELTENSTVQYDVYYSACLDSFQLMADGEAEELRLVEDFKQKYF